MRKSCLNFLMAIGLILFTGNVMAQNSMYTGTYMTPNGMVTLQLKPMDSELHGILVSSEGIYALKAKGSNNSLSGTVYTNVGNYGFTGQPIQGGLSILSEGVTYSFYKTSEQHQLDGMDLTPYFGASTQQQTEQTGQNTSNIPDRTDTANTNYSGEEKELFNYIAGGQLVYYQRTSYLNDSNASSITYVNFCADGRFGINWDGGFSVEGDYGGNAHGVTRGSNYGTWHLERRQGNVVGVLNFADGTQNVYTINRNYLMQGRWRIGNTQYAFVRNKAVCR